MTLITVSGSKVVNPRRLVCHPRPGCVDRGVAVRGRVLARHPLVDLVPKRPLPPSKRRGEEMSCEEFEGSLPGELSRALVVHGVRVPVREGVTGFVAVDRDPWALRYRAATAAICTSGTAPTSPRRQESLLAGSGAARTICGTSEGKTRCAHSGIYIRLTDQLVRLSLRPCISGWTHRS